MNVRILGLVQDFSFATGETQNYLKLELPDGSIIQSAVDADVAMATVRAHVGMGEKLAETAPVDLRVNGEAEFKPPRDPFPPVDPTEPAPSTRGYAPARLPDEPAQEFGGIEEFPEESEEEEALPAPHWSTVGQARLPLHQQGKDPGELSGDGQVDEDGVGSI